MAHSLDYKEFDKTQILKEGYAARYHEEAENEENLLRKKLVEVFSGKAAIPMAVLEFPSDNEAIASQLEYFEQATERLKSDKPVRVEIVADDRPPA